MILKRPPLSAAPVLTLPVGTTLSTTTARLTVTTSKTGGTLYVVVTTSATPPSAGQVKLGQNNGGTAAVFAANQSVVTLGAKTTTATGLTDATTYFSYSMHEDASAQQSNVAAAASFLTADVTAPVLTLPTADPSGSTTADISVTTDTAAGTLYYVITTSATRPIASQVEAGQDHLGVAAPSSGSQTVTLAGIVTIAATGLSAGTTYYTYFMHKDVASNRSDVAAAGSFFSDAADVVAPTATFISPVDGDTNVATASNLVITFSETVIAGTGSVRLFLANGTLVETFTAGTAAVVISGTGTSCIATMNPTSDMTFSAAYYVQVTPGAFRDAAGNQYAGITDTTSWNFTISAVTAPIVANQPLSFGKKTKASAGGTPLTNTGGAITSASITGGNTGVHWQISATGIITPTAAGVTAALASGPYALVLSLTNAGGTVTPTVTVTCTGTDANGNNLALSWSVADHTELAAAAVAAAFGDNVLLRTGTAAYNPLQTGTIGRSTAQVTALLATGPWVPPSLYSATYPDQGYDLSTGNFVKITKHAGASPVISRLRFLGNQGGAAGAFQYFRIHNLAIVYTPLIALTNPGATYTAAAITCDNGSHTVAIDRCDISSQTNEDLAEFLQMYSGIKTGVGGPSWIQDNDIHDCGTPIAIFGADTTVIGNNCYRCWGDGISALPGSNLTIAYNHSYAPRIQDGSSLGVNLHPDFAQFANASLSVTNIRFIGNRFQNGDYVQDLVRNSLDHGAQGPFGGPNPAGISGSISGTVLTVNSRTGAFISDGMTVYGTNVLSGTTIVYPQLNGTANSVGQYTVSKPHTPATGTQSMMATHTIRNSVVAGNMIVISEQANMLNFNSWGDSQVYNNTVAMDAAGLTGNGNLFMTNPDGIDLRYNISNGIGTDTNQAGFIARTATTGRSMNNVVLQAAYAANYASPASGSSITNLATQFDTKAGVYTTETTNMIPGANSTYINFGSRAVGAAWDATGRTHDFPWAESGHNIANAFTDVTDIAISTATTSNRVTFAGLSATGALVTVTGGSFTIYSAANAVVRASGTDSYVAVNGQKIDLQLTSSGSSETAVTMTVKVGTTTDTWSVSTAVVLTTPAFAYLWTDTDDVNRTSYTFSSKSINSDHANRRLRIAIHTPLVAVTAVSVGGVAATSVVSNTHSSIWTLSTAATALAGLTTANVVVTTASTCSRISISMWADYASSGTATASGSDTDAATADSVVSLDVVPSGHVIYVGSQNTTLGVLTATWAGSDTVVADYPSTQRESTSTVTMGHINTTETATRNLTLSESVSGQKVLVAASFAAPS